MQEVKLYTQNAPQYEGDCEYRTSSNSITKGTLINDRKKGGKHLEWNTDSRCWSEVRTKRKWRIGTNNSLVDVRTTKASNDLRCAVQTTTIHSLCSPVSTS